MSCYRFPCPITQGLRLFGHALSSTSQPRNAFYLPSKEPLFLQVSHFKGPVEGCGDLLCGCRCEYVLDFGGCTFSTMNQEHQAKLEIQRKRCTSSMGSELIQRHVLFVKSKPFCSIKGVESLSPNSWQHLHAAGMMQPDVTLQLSLRSSVSGCGRLLSPEEATSKTGSVQESPAVKLLKSSQHS